MSFLGRFFREKKSSSVGHTLVVSPGQATWSGRDYKAFAREAYQMNVVAYQAVNRVADAVAGVDWAVYKGDTEQESHSIVQLLKRPNPHQSGKEYFRALVSYYMLSGNSYTERLEVSGETKELYQLRPDRMSIVPSTQGDPSAFVHASESGAKTTFAAQDDSIWHMKAFNPTNDWYGQSPVEAGAFAVDQSNEAMKWIQALLQNGSRPSGAVKVPADNPLSDEDFTNLKNEITESYTGSRNGGRPMLLQGVDWVQLGLSPSDMGILETKFSASRDIALAFGVPPQLIGIPGDNTYANYSEARISFWEDTVIPLVDLIAADLTAWLGRRDGVEVRPALEKVPAIVEKRQSLWQMIDASTDLTVNEKRKIKGYPEIKGGDVLLVGSGLIGLEDASASLALEPGGQAGEGAPSTGALGVAASTGVDVQRQALNSAQMASLQAVIQAVSDGLLPADSAVEMLLVAIPTLTRPQVESMIHPADGFESTSADIDGKALRLVAGYETIT
jgi:HK97 family phage portal protein